MAIRTYEAILEHGQVRWVNQAPTTTEPVRVQVIVPEPPSAGPSLADLLQQLAARGGIRNIDDPAAWQRVVRQDRPMPGRSD